MYISYTTPTRQTVGVNATGHHADMIAFAISFAIIGISSAIMVRLLTKD